MELSTANLRLKIERYIIYIIPIIATCIFLNQIYRQYAFDLTVWKGGGMGMFAALDHPRANRFVNIYIVDNNGDRLPFSGYEELSYRVTAEPSEKNLDVLLKKLITTKWRYSNQKIPILQRENDGSHTPLEYLPRPTPYGNNTIIDLRSIEVEYGQVYYDSATKKLYSEILKERYHEFTK